VSKPKGQPTGILEPEPDLLEWSHLPGSYRAQWRNMWQSEWTGLIRHRCLAFEAALGVLPIQPSRTNDGHGVPRTRIVRVLLEHFNNSAVSHFSGKPSESGRAGIPHSGAASEGRFKASAVVTRRLAEAELR
jgi:hypothetical protein